MDYSPPDFSVYGIFQARILEWVAIYYSKKSSQLRDQTCVSCIGSQILYHCTPPGKSLNKACVAPRIVKAMVFPVVRYRCEIWTTKILSGEELMLFWLWCWRRLLKVPWTARISNQSILKESNPEYWSWSSNALTTCFEELTHWKRPWSWERLKATGEGGGRGWELDSIME